jgi:hypothetical protein
METSRVVINKLTRNSKKVLKSLPLTGMETKGDRFLSRMFERVLKSLPLTGMGAIPQPNNFEGKNAALPYSRTALHNSANKLLSLITVTVDNRSNINTHRFDFTNWQRISLPVTLCIHILHPSLW